MRVHVPVDATHAQSVRVARQPAATGASRGSSQSSSKESPLVARHSAGTHFTREYRNTGSDNRTTTHADTPHVSFTVHTARYRSLRDTLEPRRATGCISVRLPTVSPRGDATELDGLPCTCQLTLEERRTRYDHALPPIFPRAELRANNPPASSRRLQYPRVLHLITGMTSVRYA